MNYRCHDESLFMAQNKHKREMLSVWRNQEDVPGGQSSERRVDRLSVGERSVFLTEECLGRDA